jgi:hypothetical protein
MIPKNALPLAHKTSQIAEDEDSEIAVALKHLDTEEEELMISTDSKTGQTTASTSKNEGAVFFF